MVITYLRGMKLKINNSNNFKGKIPKWFKEIETNYTLSKYRTLTYPLKDTIAIPHRLQS